MCELDDIQCELKSAKRKASHFFHNLSGCFWTICFCKEQIGKSEEVEEEKESAMTDEAVDDLSCTQLKDTGVDDALLGDFLDVNGANNGDHATIL